jgi:hypothetical protein
MTKTEYKAKLATNYRAARAAIRSHVAHHILFARGMAILASMDATLAMVAFRNAEALMERVGSVGGANIGNKAYARGAAMLDRIRAKRKL